MKGIKDCPFCGGEAHLECKGEWGETWYFIRCSKCLIRTDVNLRSSMKKIKSTWNKRVKK